MSDKAHFPPANPVSSGLKGRCPRCGEGRLFKGFLTVGKGCGNCGLDYDFADSGDGPAVFVIMLVGFLIIGLVLAVELAYQPPIWLHMIVWLPLTVIVAACVLRPLKGLMIALQYRNNAQEGQIDQ